MIKRTKHWGLKKIKLISRHNKNWVASPHITLRSMEQYREKMLGKKPRLLVRTDEKGKNYDSLSWRELPRTETITQKTTKNPKIIIEEEFKKKLSKKNISKKAVLILHPTFKRKNINFFGNLTLFPNGKIIICYTSQKSICRTNKVHRTATVNETSLHIIKTRTGYRFKGISGLNSLKNKRLKKGIFNALQFMKKGLELEQIKLGRNTKIHFIGWKKTGDKKFDGGIEIFDMEESVSIR